MKTSKIITAKYEGELRSLTVPQWSELLNKSTKHLYGRKNKGLSDQEVIEGVYLPMNKKVIVTIDSELSEHYQAFNFNNAISEWRKNNGI